MVLLPQEAQDTGAVLVTTNEESTRLDQPWQSVTVNSKGGMTLEGIEKQEVDEIFGAVLSALPPAPVFLQIRFLNDTIEIDPASTIVLEELFKIVDQREAVQIEITGHTDTLGSEADNDALSIQRASSIRDMLADLLREKGLDPSTIRIAGRGERDLMVQTEDEVSEPSNRRVEITIR